MDPIVIFIPETRAADGMGTVEVPITFDYSNQTAEAKVKVHGVFVRYRVNLSRRILNTAEISAFREGIETELQRRVTEFWNITNSRSGAITMAWASKEDSSLYFTPPEHPEDYWLCIGSHFTNSTGRNVCSEWSVQSPTGTQIIRRELRSIDPGPGQIEQINCFFVGLIQELIERYCFVEIDSYQQNNHAGPGPLPILLRRINDNTITLSGEDYTNRLYEQFPNECSMPETERYKHLQWTARFWPRTKDKKKQIILREAREAVREMKKLEELQKEHHKEYVRDQVLPLLKENVNNIIEIPRCHDNYLVNQGWLYYKEYSEGRMWKINKSAQNINPQEVYDSTEATWVDCLMKVAKPTLAQKRKWVGHLIDSINKRYLRENYTQIPYFYGGKMESRYRYPAIMEAEKKLTRPEFEQELWVKAGFTVMLDEAEDQLRITKKFNGYKIEDRFIVDCGIEFALTFRMSEKKFLYGRARSSTHSGPFHPHINGAGHDRNEWQDVCNGGFSDQWAIPVFKHPDPDDLNVLLINYLNGYNGSSPYQKPCKSGWSHAYDLKLSAFVPKKFVCGVLCVPNRLIETECSGH